MSTVSPPVRQPLTPRRGLAHRFGVDLIVRSLLEILVIAIFIVTFIVQPVRIPSPSMEPTLRPGDFTFADKQSFANEGWLASLMPATTIRRGDLAVFHYPPNPSVDLVKRVVGLPGDRIRLRNGHLWVNGHLLRESYAWYSASPVNPYRDDFPFLRAVDPNVDPAWWIALQQDVRDGDLIVPPNCFFVLGDNRNDSEDSRYWGFVPRRDFVGRPLLVYLSAPSDDVHGAGARLWSAWSGFRILH